MAMHNTTRSEPSLDEIDCFSCERGCVHFEFGSTILSFKRDTFFHIAELFAETRAEMLADETLTDDWSEEIYN